MKRTGQFAAALALVALLAPERAHAHIKLLKPASWLNEDPLGGPQKGSPCGPGNSKLIIGDDVQPVPVSGAVTTFHAGETIQVAWEETIYHPGYFRISLAKTRPADATVQDFPDPALTDKQDCHYDRAAVKTTPHDQVLADGLFMTDSQEGTGRSLSQSVTLPNEPCEHCTLQIVQIMEGHPGASCFYYHCAELQIVAAEAQHTDAGSAGSGTSDAGSAGSGTSDAGSEQVDAEQTRSDAGTSAPDSGDDSGCSIAPARGHKARAAGWLLGCGLLGWTWQRRRARKASLRG